MPYNQIFKSVEGDLVYVGDTTSTVQAKPYALSLSITQIAADTNKIRFSLGVTDAPSMKNDVQVLLDKVALCLLTTLGESSFNPTMGSFLTRIKTKTQDVLELQAQLIAAIRSVQNMILASQSEQVLSPEQTLKQLKLQSMYQDPIDPTTVLVEVLVLTNSNTEYILTA